jgi:hypothetical protein
MDEVEDCMIAQCEWLMNQLRKEGMNARLCFGSMKWIIIKFGNMMLSATLFEKDIYDIACGLYFATPMHSIRLPFHYIPIYLQWQWQDLFNRKMISYQLYSDITNL